MEIGPLILDKIFEGLLPYEWCSLILVINAFSPKPASVLEQKHLVVIDWFFAILKSLNHFRTMQFIIAKQVPKEGHPYDTLTIKGLEEQFYTCGISITLQTHR